MVKAAAALLSLSCLATFAAGQTADVNSSEQPRAVHGHSTAKHDVGSGAGDIGKGVVKGAGGAAKATGSAAVDLATLHPVNAAADLGKGAAGAGASVGVGAAKGTGKIVKGTGKALRHLF